jgi:hypothetical protein
LSSSGTAKSGCMKPENPLQQHPSELSLMAWGWLTVCLSVQPWKNTCSSGKLAHGPTPLICLQHLLLLCGKCVQIWWPFNCDHAVSLPSVLLLLDACSGRNQCDLQLVMAVSEKFNQCVHQSSRHLSWTMTGDQLAGSAARGCAGARRCAEAVIGAAPSSPPCSPSPCTSENNNKIPRSCFRIREIEFRVARNYQGNSTALQICNGCELWAVRMIPFQSWAAWHQVSAWTCCCKLQRRWRRQRPVPTAW